MKGFTLIELLAVIVILAIVALIATPLILNVIDDSKKGAFKSSAYGIIEAAELEYAKNIMDGTKEETMYTYVEGEQISSENKRLEFKGSKPESGNVFVNREGKTAIIIYSGNLCAEKNFEETEVRITSKSKEECQIPETFECGKTFFDERDGNVYRTVEIGSQCWMADDLKYTGSGCLDNSWSNPEYNGCKKATEENLENNEEYRDWLQYAVWYQWGAAQESCPTGWLMPTFNDWMPLTESLVDNSGDRMKMKSDDLNWCNNTDPSICGTSGFNALPVSFNPEGGMAEANRVFWWTSFNPVYTPALNGIYTYGHMINRDSSDLEYAVISPNQGAPARCLYGQ